MARICDLSTNAIGANCRRDFCNHPDTWCRPCLLNQRDDANAKIAELRAVVDKLPKTADGVAVYPGMDLWYVNSIGSARVETCHDSQWPCCDGYHSTEAAALAAKASTEEPANEPTS